MSRSRSSRSRSRWFRRENPPAESSQVDVPVEKIKDTYLHLLEERKDLSRHF